ncbi:MAG: DUF222 domain-containing protein [Acidimicrobiales bacterium]|nr:DUF222 domain-containing protein [Acidimicrobiales bacterium]
MIRLSWECRVVAARAPITDRFVVLARQWAQSQYELVMLSLELADSSEWLVAGASTPAQHLAAIADVEACTAREWLRVGRRVRELPVIGAAFADGSLSYSKVRALIVVATPANEAELATLAREVPASALRKVLAAWMNKTMTPEELDAYHQQRRSVAWRTDPDGMIIFTLRLPPALAAVLISLLTTLVMRTRARPDASGVWPTLAQQHADAFAELLTSGSGEIHTEVIFHVRADGCSADDGTPITEAAIGRLLPDASIRALIHDAAGRPINASGRHRHPSARQKRVVKERDRACVDCGRTTLLQYDHQPPYEQTGHTVVDEIHLRCAPCHHARHRR